MRTYSWGRVSNDYIPFVQYEMPANAATSTNIQSDAFAEVILASLNAPIQEDTNSLKAFPQILNGGVATGYVTTTTTTTCLQTRDLDTNDRFKMATHSGFVCTIAKSFQRRLGVKTGRTFLSDKRFPKDFYVVNNILLHYCSIWFLHRVTIACVCVEHISKIL